MKRVIGLLNIEDSNIEIRIFIFNSFINFKFQVNMMILIHFEKSVNLITTAETVFNSLLPPYSSLHALYINNE